MTAAFGAFMQTYPAFDYEGIRRLPYRLFSAWLAGVDLSPYAVPDPERAEQRRHAAIARLDDYRRREGIA